MAGVHGRIIVGVDGSEDSKQALRWAVAQAERTGQEVEAIAAWEVPVTILLLPTAVEDDYADRAATVLSETLHETIGDEPPVRVRARAAEGRAARVLTAAATADDTLVIGSHGRGKLPGMHLGSTASYCVHHAPCPVVVLRSAPA
jgi:nucleotide-binding universal stress UspA family protein